MIRMMRLPSSPAERAEAFLASPGVHTIDPGIKIARNVIVVVMQIVQAACAETADIPTDS